MNECRWVRRCLLCVGDYWLTHVFREPNLRMRKTRPPQQQFRRRRRCSQYCASHQHHHTSRLFSCASHKITQFLNHEVSARKRYRKQKLVTEKDRWILWILMTSRGRPADLKMRRFPPRLISSNETLYVFCVISCAMFLCLLPFLDVSLSLTSQIWIFL